MKVNIDIDMTPTEFREAMGMPDVKSVQDRWMQTVESAVNDEIAKLSPEAIAKKWSEALTPNADFLGPLMQMMNSMNTNK